MRKIVAVAVALLVLTGCSATEPVEAAPASTQEAEQQAEETAPAPLEAEPADETEPTTPEAQFVESLRPYDLPVFQESTDEQLIAAGTLACDHLAAGETTGQFSLIENEEKSENGNYVASMMIADNASVFLCN